MSLIKHGVVAMCLLFAGTVWAAGEPFVIKDSPHSVDDTVARLEALIEAAPPTLMAKIDHGANAEQAGLELGESVLLILGAPKVGTPIMQENVLAGLMLPAKILVYDDNGQTRMAFINPATFANDYDAEGAEEQIKMMTGALHGLTNKAAE